MTGWSRIVLTVYTRFSKTLFLLTREGENIGCGCGLIDGASICPEGAAHTCNSENPRGGSYTHGYNSMPPHFKNFRSHDEDLVLCATQLSGCQLTPSLQTHTQDSFHLRWPMFAVLNDVNTRQCQNVIVTRFGKASI